MKHKDTAPEQSLERLFRLAASGDGAAFEQIVLATEKQVYNLTFSMLHNREDAEDTTQETYLKLWRSLSTFRGDCQPLSWIYRIARNSALDLLRSHGSHPVAPLTYADDGSGGEPRDIDIPDDDPDSDPAEAYIRKNDAEQIRAAVADLPDAAREMITMRDINGMSYLEISQTLGIPQGTVKSRLSRSREALIKILRRRNIT